MVKRGSLLVLFLGQTGCDQIKEWRDQVSGLTNRFVVEGVYMGVEEPEDDRIASVLEETDFGDGSSVTAYLADASEIDDLENAPITGATIAFHSPATGGYNLDEESNGKYTLTDVTYVPGETVKLSSTYDGTVREIQVTVPASPDGGIPWEHTEGTGMTVDLTGQGYDSAMVVVIDIVNRTTTFSERPESISDFYNLAHGDEAALTIDIPSEAFSGQSLYAVGVAGVVFSEEDDYQEVNTALSTFMAGRFVFEAVCAFDDVDICDEDFTDE
jgi:hypothetical protein